MIQLSTALVCVVGVGCLLYADNDGASEQEVVTRSVADCLVAPFVSPDEMAEIATMFQVPGYLVVQQPGLQLVSDECNAAIVLSRTHIAGGLLKYFGQQLLSEEIVRYGLIWNSGTDDLLFVSPKTGDEYVVHANEMVVVGNYLRQEIDALTMLSSHSCTVVCKGDYYACCNYGMPPTCRCYLNGFTHQSDVGGSGTTSCSIGIDP